MGKVESIYVNGLDLWFYSNDSPPHPPHFHARRPGEWEIKVYFLLCTPDHLEYDMKWPLQRREIPRNYRRELLRVIVDKRVELLVEYERKTNA